MPRPLRINYPGAYYHVMNRGAGYQDIFRADEHRQIFVDLLREFHETYQVNIHVYCLMGNHYHLLLETTIQSVNRWESHWVRLRRHLVLRTTVAHQE